MRWLIITALLLSSWPGWAGVGGATISWQMDSGWTMLDAPNGATELESTIDGALAARRLAIRFSDGGKIVGEVWDNYQARSVNLGIDTGSEPLVRIRAQALAYDCRAWRPASAVSSGDRICVGEFPSNRWAMVATTAGNTGTIAPDWPTKHSFRLALTKHFPTAAVVDAGAGQVSLPVPGHLFHMGDVVTVEGTANYDGTYVLPDQGPGGADAVIITHAYVAEVLQNTATIAIADSAVVDNGDGTVSIPCPNHGFVGGEDVTVAGTVSYDGSFTIGAQSNPDRLTIAHAYVAEVISGGYAIDKTVTDGSTVWAFTEYVTPFPAHTSSQSMRVIGRLDGTQFKSSGTKFLLRAAP